MNKWEEFAIKVLRGKKNKELIINNAENRNRIRMCKLNNITKWTWKKIFKNRSQRYKNMSDKNKIKKNWINK